jgi:hypothetical protein
LANVQAKFRQRLKIYTQEHEMTKAFASQGGLAEKKIRFSENGERFFAFTAEGVPN